MQQGLWSQSGGHKENIEEKCLNNHLKEDPGNEREMGRGTGRVFRKRVKLSQLWVPLCLTWLQWTSHLQVFLLVARTRFESNHWVNVHVGVFIWGRNTKGSNLCCFSFHGVFFVQIFRRTIKHYGHCSVSLCSVSSINPQVIQQV